MRAGLLHNYTADIGSLRADDEGTKWTMINVSENTLTFISENISEDECHYAFKQQVSGELTHIENRRNTDDIAATADFCKAGMAPSIRYTKREIIPYVNGKPARGMGMLFAFNKP